MTPTALPVKSAILPKRRWWQSLRASTVFKFGFLVGLVGWTISTGLERPALRRAEDEFAKAQKSGEAREFRLALQHALDDLRIFRLSRSSSLIAARSLSRLLYPDQAESHYRTALWYGNLPLEAEHDRIQGLFRGLENERGVELCHEVLKRYPEDPVTLKYLATAEWIKGRLPKAREAADRLSKIEAGRVDGLTLLIDIHRDAERREQAVAVCEELLKIEPELKHLKPLLQLDFWRRLGDDLVVLHRPAEARDYLLNVITPYSDPVLLDILGSAYKDLNELDEAEKCWRESARRKPERLNAWLRLGGLAITRKRFADAVESLEKAVKIAPESISAHRLLAQAYLLTGREADAKAQSEMADKISLNAPPPPGGMGPAQ